MIKSTQIPIYVGNIENDTKENDKYRKVIFTGKYSQLVLMSIKPLDGIKKEIHQDHDQFIRIEKGSGIAKINGVDYSLTDGFAITIPAGTEHEILNSSNTDDLKLYTVYSPPEHPKNTVQTENPNKYIKKYFLYKGKCDKLTDLLNN